MAKPALPESQGAMAVCVGLGAELARMKGCSSDECRCAFTGNRKWAHW